MRIAASHLLLAIALAASPAATAPVAAADSPKRARADDAMTLTFNGNTYVYRWAKAGQYEFLQRNDSDLAKWHDMMTVNLHESARTGESLAGIANSIVANYQRVGKIIRTDSKPRTATAPAEHVIVAVLGSPDFLEAAFARVLLVESSGIVVVYSHRIYGKAAGPAMSDWLKANGPKVEAALKTWNGVPTAAALKKLPPRE